MTGRSFASVRQGVKSTADHWARSSRALKKDDQPYGEKLVELAKRHASEAFYGCDDPLEAAVFSVLVEMIKKQEQQEQDQKESDVDP
ncbi:MAG: hypothetical protein NTV10_01095 [Methanoregula sp.]|nr:hypothetical protein [Methanoregula sp.]